MPYYRDLVAKGNETIHMGPCELSRSLYARGAEGFEFGLTGEDSDGRSWSFDENYPYVEGEMGSIHEEVSTQYRKVERLVYVDRSWWSE